ncbi:MAG: PDZ domain-containing protein [Saprospiraceae bacterium]|nr:PDZ domain-containing protein [Saprospiraceae bacterium]
MTIEPNQKYNIIQPLLLACVMAIGIMIGFKIKGNNQRYALIEKWDASEGIRQTGRVEELLRFIESKYVDSIDTDTILDDAIFALIDNLDPHSEYLTPVEVEDVNNQMEGHFKGIGVETIMIKDTATIYKVLQHSPAKKAGLLSGDKILKVDGVDVAGVLKPFSEIRTLMKKSDDKIGLQIKRGKKIMSLSTISEEIIVPTISSAYNVNDSVIYIKIDRFGNNTYQHFMDKVESLVGKSGYKDVMIDVRGNPGGFLPEATNILCQIFEEKNKILVTTKGKSEKKYEYKSTGKRFFNIRKVVVLVDENSASASEILAGAIQDWDRGVVVGRRTYGKGLVQEQYDLSNGGAIRLTIAKYFTPSGRSIQRNYDDKSKYDDDYNNRVVNGEYFDNTPPKKEKSNQTFQSLIKKRRLESGGGIHPDVFVPLDSMFFHEKYPEIETDLIEFYLQNTQSPSFKNIQTFDQIKSFNLKEDVYNLFLKNANASLTKQEEEKFFPIAEKFLRLIIANIKLTDEQSVQIDNTFDETYKAGIEQFSKK